MHTVPQVDAVHSAFSLFLIRFVHICADFWATATIITVRSMLQDHCPVYLSVCNVGVLWPNGWMDQEATWYRGRPQPRRHCVR